MKRRVHTGRRFSFNLLLLIASVWLGPVGMAFGAGETDLECNGTYDLTNQDGAVIVTIRITSATRSTSDWNPNDLLLEGAVSIEGDTLKITNSSYFVTPRVLPTTVGVSGRGKCNLAAGHLREGLTNSAKLFRCAGAIYIEKLTTTSIPAVTSIKTSYIELYRAPLVGAQYWELQMRMFEATFYRRPGT